MAPEQATIYSALIGIVGAILGALITTFGPHIVQGFRASDQRFAGKWTGTAEDISVTGYVSVDHPLTYDLTLELTRRGDMVTGTLHVQTHDPKRFSGHCKVAGIGISGDFLAIKYALTDQDASHIGLCLFELHEAGKELRGLFLSKKIFEKRLGFGAVTLAKK